MLQCCCNAFTQSEQSLDDLFLFVLVFPGKCDSFEQLKQGCEYDDNALAVFFVLRVFIQQKKTLHQLLQIAMVDEGDQHCDSLNLNRGNVDCDIV